MSQNVDWTDLGIFPAQDHESGVEIEARQFLAAGRIKELDEKKVLVWAKQDGMGTLGDVHPWKFWQTKDRKSGRPFGSWQNAFAGIVTSTGGGSSRVITPSASPGRVADNQFTPRGDAAGGPADTAPIGARPPPGGEESTTPGGEKSTESVNVLPIRNSAYEPDTRYAEIPHKVPPKIDPPPPVGSVVVAMAGTEESRQEDVIVFGGGAAPLVAVNWSPPADMGTLVYDLEPYGTLAIGQPAGVGGRGARIHSAWRVLRMPDRLKGVGKAPGNGVAWQLTSSEQDGLAGYGLCYGKGDGSRDGDQTTPTQPGDGKEPVITPNWNTGLGGTAGGINGPPTVAGGVPVQPGYGRVQGPPGG